jgi:hypothetical protein
MFRFTAIATLFCSAAALKVDSPAGQALLAQSRNLEQNAYSWIMDYSMVFQSCHMVHQFAGEDGGEDGNTVSYMNLVKYKLCPSKKCKYGCKGAEYVTDMDSFVDAYTEWQMNDKEYKCEQQREKCGCDDYYGDEDVCEQKCYNNAGMSYCIEEENDDDAYVFELQDWTACAQSEALDGYGNQLYVGPKCSENGEQINLGVFTDEFCTESYSSEIFAKYYGGTTLPYQDENIVAENCISCKQIEMDNGYYQGAEVTEICEETYPASAKCEENIASSLSYPVTAGCEYIKNIKLYERYYKPVSGAASTAFAVIFGLSTVVLAGVAAHLYKLNSRKIELQTDAAVV